VTSPPTSEVVKTKCAQCKSSTQHETLCRSFEEDATEDGNWYEIECQILRCMGCRSMSFRKLTMSSGDCDDEGRPEKYEVLYPEPEERQTAFPLWQLPDGVARLYAETIIAFNHKAVTLAAAGLRSVVEATCLDKGCNGNNLKLKIDELISNGVLSKQDADYLQEHRLLGNEAVHEMRGPPVEELILALQILEHLLKTLDILPEVNKKLRKLRSTRGTMED
jgi:hypothetical protein